MSKNAAASRRGEQTDIHGSQRPARRRRLRLMALMMAIVIPLTMILGSMGSAGAQDEDTSKLSFYKVASAMSSYFSTSSAPGGKWDSSWNSFRESAGNSGSFLGYLDPDFSLSPGWIESKLSGSSDALGYQTLDPRDANNGRVAKGGTGMADYAHYGAALNGLGLDSTSTGLSLSFGAKIGGGIIMLLYMFTFVVDLLFSWLIGLLAWMNPFKLFYAGVRAISPTFAEGMVGGNSGTPTALDGITGWIGGWYQTLNNLAWDAMVPIFIGTFLFSLLLFKNLDRGSAIKKLLIRLVFIGVGLPLLGSMYTTMLSSMSSATQAGNMGSTRVVLSTYVDFESWATLNRLKPPTAPSSLIAWDVKAGQPTGASLQNVRNTALAVNGQALGISSLTPIISDGTSSWSQNAQASNESFNFGTYLSVSNLLDRYMSGSQVTAAAFENDSKGLLTASPIFDPDSDVGDPEMVLKWFEDYTDEDKLAERGGDAMENPVLAVESGLVATEDNNEKTFSSVSVVRCGSNGREISTPDEGLVRNCNLSPLAMYNYLNTDFGSTSMTLYSSGNVMSEATRSIHKSVNLVGTGTMSFVYWLNAVVLLGSFVIIGIAYAGSLFVANVKRSIQLIVAIPFASVGALSGIAKVIIYTFVLIMESVATIFIYKIVQELLLSLPQIIEAPFAGVLRDDGAGGNFGEFLIAGAGFSLIVTIVSIIFVLLFTIMALRLRKSLVKAMEEGTTKLVEKFMDTKTGGPGGGGRMAPALAGGAAAGAGSAVANRMMGQGKGGDKAAGEGSNAGGTGPDPIGTEPDSGDDAAPGDDPAGVGPGELPGGDGSGMDGDLNTDGELGGALALNAGPGADGEGTAVDDSTPPAPGADPSGEEALGRDVAVSGLSGAPGGAEVADSTENGVDAAVVGTVGDPDGQGEPVSDVDSPNVNDDSAGAAMTDSVEESAGAYAESDAKRVEAAGEGVKAVGSAAEGVARGAAGDEAGAVEAAGKTVEHAGEGAAKNQEAQAMSKEAGQSSLDGPADTSKNEERAGQARGASAAGKQVSDVAGQAGSVSGGSVPSSGDGPTPGADGPGSSAPSPTNEAGSAPTTGPAPGREAPAKDAPSQGGGGSSASRAAAAQGVQHAAQVAAAPKGGRGNGGGNGGTQEPSRNNAALTSSKKSPSPPPANSASLLHSKRAPGSKPPPKPKPKAPAPKRPQAPKPSVSGSGPARQAPPRKSPSRKTAPRRQGAKPVPRQPAKLRQPKGEGVPTEGPKPGDSGTDSWL